MSKLFIFFRVGLHQMQGVNEAIQTGSRLIACLMALFALCTGFEAAATPVDAKAAKSLITGRVWQQKARTGPGLNYWSWASDGSLCLRAEDRNSKCADTGRWRLEKDRLCYDLKWGGLTYGAKSGCFRISEKGSGLYEALQDNGLALFEFSVVD